MKATRFSRKLVSRLKLRVKWSLLASLQCATHHVPPCFKREDCKSAGSCHCNTGDSRRLPRQFVRRLACSLSEDLSRRSFVGHDFAALSQAKQVELLSAKSLAQVWYSHVQSQSSNRTS